MTEPTLTTASIEGDDQRAYFQIARLSATSDREMYLLSAVAPQTTARQVAACLRNKKSKYRVTVDGWKYDSAKDGWTCKLACLGLDTWHLIAVSNCPRFLASATPEGLWRWIRSDQCTVPVIKDWLPWLYEEFDHTHRLRKLDGINPMGCLITLTDETVHKAIAKGLKSKAIWIPDGSERSARQQTA